MPTEMTKFRNLLDESSIKWRDASSVVHGKNIYRTHIGRTEDLEFEWSVINSENVPESNGKLEVFNSKQRTKEKGFLTAEEAFFRITGKKCAQ